jgi:hypothetical protein
MTQTWLQGGRDGSRRRCAGGDGSWNWQHKRGRGHRRGCGCGQQLLLALCCIAVGSATDPADDPFGRQEDNVIALTDEPGPSPLDTIAELQGRLRTALEENAALKAGCKSEPRATTGLVQQSAPGGNNSSSLCGRRHVEACFSSGFTPCPSQYSDDCINARVPWPARPEVRRRVGHYVAFDFELSLSTRPCRRV